MTALMANIIIMPMFFSAIMILVTLVVVIAVTVTPLRI